MTFPDEVHSFLRYQPVEKAAPRPEGTRSRLDNVLILLSRERQRAVRRHFSAGCCANWLRAFRAAADFFERHLGSGRIP